jgi:hypothetical protein
MISEHVYERNLTGDLALVMPTGVQVRCFEIDFPHAADITKLIVQQATGVATGFRVNLYNQAAACAAAGSSSSSSSSSVAGGASTALSEASALAKVIPTQHQHEPAGAMELFHPQGYSFKNMEGTFTVPIKKIYLELVLDVFATASTWNVALGGRPKF